MKPGALRQESRPAPGTIDFSDTLPLCGKRSPKELSRNNFSIVRRIFLRECHSKIRRIAGYVTDF